MTHHLDLLSEPRPPSIQLSYGATALLVRALADDPEERWTGDCPDAGQPGRPCDRRYEVGKRLTCQVFRCPGCGRVVPMCFGNGDGDPRCNDCWGEPLGEELEGDEADALARALSLLELWEVARTGGLKLRPEEEIALFGRPVEREGGGS